MKSDFSRLTDRPDAQYHAVRLQQGRVQTDADFNEQQDVVQRRVETETVDVVGAAGAPLAAAGFELSVVGGQIGIAAGRFYVDGLLLRNPAACTVITQPWLPRAVSPVVPTTPLFPAPQPLLGLPPAAAPALTDIRVYDSTGAAVLPTVGLYVGYLEAWLRHVTALEDPLLREVALGGPDTATREQLAWQVKLLRAGALGDAISCITAEPFDSYTAASAGKLAARALPGVAASDPCELSPEAGYRRLENQLYRVEVHDDGSVLGKARFKWQRDNGSIVSEVTRWVGEPGPGEFEVASLGRDDVLAITVGCWIEFFDDRIDLLGRPGTLAQVLKTDGRIVTIDTTPAKVIGPALDQAAYAAHPRVRRWDGIADLVPAAEAAAGGWVQLEGGVEVKFTPGKLRVGDWWTIPARTATADVEWPKDAASGKPVFVLPQGIRRAFARLAILSFNGSAWSLVSDCRPLFPSLNELTDISYVGGDAQVVIDGEPLLLPKPLEVGVMRGSLPVANAVVRFTASSGKLANGLAVYDAPVAAADRGIAKTSWTLDGSQPHQYVSAELLEAGAPSTTRYMPVHFSAHIVASCECTVHVTPAQQAADGTALQRAIKTLIDRGGGALCLDAGIYDLPASLALDGVHDLAIRGKGRDLTRLRCAAGAVIDGGTVRNLSFEGLALESTGQVGSDVVRFVAVDGIALEQVAVRGALKGFTGTALMVRGPQARARANDCVFEAEAGWWVSDGNDAFDAGLHLSSCHFNCAQTGLILSTGGTQLEAHIKACRFDGCAQIGVHLIADAVRVGTVVEGATSLVEIEGNQFSISGDGIAVSAPLVRVVGNALVCTDPKNASRAVEVTAYDACIEGNRIVSFQEGADVFEAERASLTRNHVIGAALGLSVFNARHASVADNVLEALDQFPQQSESSTTDLIAIRVWGMDSISVTSNKISSVGLQGLATGNTVSGIEVWGGENALITGNVITDFAPAGPYGASPTGIEVVGIQGATDVSGNVIRRQEGDPKGVNSDWVGLQLGQSSSSFARFTEAVLRVPPAPASKVASSSKAPAPRKASTKASGATKSGSAAKPGRTASLDAPTDRSRLDVPVTLPAQVVSELDRFMGPRPSLLSAKTQQALYAHVLRLREDWLARALGTQAAAAASWILLRNAQLLVRGNLIGGHGGTPQVLIDLYQDRPTNCDFSGNHCARTQVATTKPVQELVRIRAGTITACHNTVDGNASAGQGGFMMTLSPIFKAYTVLGNAVTRPGISVNGGGLSPTWAPLNADLN